MITVVFDTSAIISAIYWPGSTSRRCLAGFARRQYAIAVSSVVFDEYESIAAEFQPRFHGRRSAGALAWLRQKARWVEPAPLGKQRSRDIKDDIFLSCAVAAGARYLVTRDDDLLVLEKPFGIQTITPARFFVLLRETHTSGRPRPLA
jgi:putative PIN family toxin of toxin-antitoxin system